MNKPAQIAFIVPYPVGKAPSQRFRVEQLLPVLDPEKVSYKIYPFMDPDTWQVLYKGGSLWRKGLGIIKGYLKRCKCVLWDVRKAGVIFIHREAAPLGPPVFEWILTKVLRKKVIFDFDDAIWIPNTSTENKLAAAVKSFWKVPVICSWVDTVTGGNDFLCKYATDNGAKQVVKLPTVVDTTTRYNRLQQHTGLRKPVIGWTGSHSTLKYLDVLMPVLLKLQEELDFTFLVIADKQPELPLRDWTFIPWNPSTEIDDLLKIDIGVMPLTADAWSEGKCGFKLIQYMALGIPALASPVGVNSVIIEEGINGYLCTDETAWMGRLRELLVNFSLRGKMGAAGRTKIVNEYSVAAITQRFVSLFISENK